MCVLCLPPSPPPPPLFRLCTQTYIWGNAKGHLAHMCEKGGGGGGGGGGGRGGGGREEEEDVSGQ